MQKDCTIFKIPNLPETPVNNFDVSGTATVKVKDATVGEMSFKPANSGFKYYEELNSIAEELEKCRLKML
jgi:hypothetical protein